MDQYVSAIIIAIVTGIFSIILALIQKQQNSETKKMDQQVINLSKEKKLKSDLAKVREDLESTINQIMMLILDTNLSILRDISPLDDKTVADTLHEAEQLKDQFNMVMKQIKDIDHDYQLLLSITQEIESSFSSKKDK